MHWVLPIVGILLIGVAMIDLGRTLFHPSQHGNVSDYLTLVIWRAIRGHAQALITVAGPLNFIVVILYWGLSVVVGFMLIYAPFIPNQFVLSPGMDTTRFAAHPIAYAGTLSLASLITVALGIQTNSVLLQFAMGLEAVLGFVILTASISWILSIYPVIEHRRSFAEEVFLLYRTEERGLRRLEEIPETELQTILLAKVEQLTTIRTELSQFPITYYFQAREERLAVGPALSYMAEAVADLARNRPDVKVSATLAEGALEDLVEMMTKKYLEQEFKTRNEALEALNADHRRQPLHRPGRKP